MGRIITWNAQKTDPNGAHNEPNSLFYAEDVIRYLRFTSSLSIKFCLTDALRYLVGNQSVVVPPGAYFIANDGLEMECLPCQPGVRAFAVFFSNDLIRDVYQNHLFADKTLLDQPGQDAGPVHFFEHVHRQPGPLSRQMHLVAQRMAASGATADDLPPDVFFDLAESLLALQYDISRQIGRVSARGYATREELFRRVLRAREFMLDQWYADLSLNDVARYTCLSPYHFHRSFREAFGQSPMRWFRQLKLQKAKDTLATGRQTVTEVALGCGFADVFSFSRAFKQEWGLRPSAVLRKTVLPG